MNEWLIPFLFFAIALVYSSVGFGGGSSYLAVLSLLLVEFYEIRTLALLLNILVVTIGTLMSVRKHVFDWRLFWPFALFSVPASFVGAMLKLSAGVFFLLLGASLILSAAFLTWQSMMHEPKARTLTTSLRGMLGGSIGLLSGLVGIGGGIFLSPILNVMGWANPRTVASLASFFILVNSVAGLAGMVVANTFTINPQDAFPVMVAVLAGGLVGAYLANEKLHLRVIRLLTAILVTYVGIRLVLQHGFQLTLS
jgi:hypothetical protein